MPTNKSERFSEIPVHNSELTGDELMVVSKQTIPKKTHNVKTSVFREYHTGKARAENVTNIVSFGASIKGVGKPANPLSLDGDWLGGMFLKAPTNLAVTSVGDRLTRHLPISRKSLYTHNHLKLITNVTLGKVPNHPPAINIEPTGEFRIVAQGLNSTLTASYGRYSADKDLKSEQLIERGIKPTDGLPIVGGEFNLHDYEILEIFGTTATGTLALCRNVLTDASAIYYFPLLEGSISERAFSRGYYFLDSEHSFAKKIMSSSCVVFRNSADTYLMVLPNPSDATQPLDVETYTLILYPETNSITYSARNTWTVNSYVGLFINQPNLRIFDQFVGASGDKVALVNDGNHAVNLNSPTGNKTHFISVLQNPNSIDDITLYFRGYGLINPTANPANKYKYQFDIGYRIALTKSIATATALSSYLGNKPTLSGTNTVLNKRNTIVNHPTNLNSEYLQVLRDGSIVTGLNNDNTTTEPMRIHASKKGLMGYSENDISKNIGSGLIGVAHPLNFKPGYGADIATPFKLYIASPIPYMLGNNGRGVIDPQILDLSTFAADISMLKTIGNLPYVGPKYNGIEAYPVHLYIQHTGTKGILIASASNVPEAINSTYIASVWFLADGQNSILTQQAFSRLYKHRQSYRPRGMSVPVSYDNPAEQPKQFWLTKETVAVAGNGVSTTLIFRERDGSFTIPAGYRAMIYLAAGGGGGGGSIHNYSSSWYSAPRDGDPGEDTLVGLSPGFLLNTVTCGKGIGGYGANWGNGSSFSNGSPGAGGTASHNVEDSRLQVLTLTPGIKPPIGQRWSRQVGGTSVLEYLLPYSDDGHGGLGAYGVGDEGWSYGGGGGSGGGAILRFNNVGLSDVTMYYRAGAGGKGRVFPTAQTNGNSGGDGVAGFVLVELEKI